MKNWWHEFDEIVKNDFGGDGRLCIRLEKNVKKIRNVNENESEMGKK